MTSVGKYTRSITDTFVVKSITRIYKFEKKKKKEYGIQKSRTWKSNS